MFSCFTGPRPPRQSVENSKVSRAAVSNLPELLKKSGRGVSIDGRKDQGVCSDTPTDENLRIQMLNTCGIVGGDGEEILKSHPVVREKVERVAQLTMKLFKADYASVVIADGDKVVPLTVPVPAKPILRKDSICAWELLCPPDEVLVVHDARECPVLKRNPLVDREGGVVSYVGAPLFSKIAKARYGTLCAFSLEKMTITDSQVRLLRCHADMLTREFDAILEAQLHASALSVLSHDNQQLLNAVRVFSDALILVRITEEGKAVIAKANQGWEALTQNRVRDSEMMELMPMLTQNPTMQEQLSTAMVELTELDVVLPCTRRGGIAFWAYLRIRPLQNDQENNSTESDNQESSEMIQPTSTSHTGTKYCIVQLTDYTIKVESNKFNEQAIKELDRVRKEAQAAVQSKSHFLANMSHELRTPLNATLACSELILDQLPPDNEPHQLAAEIYQNSNQLLSLLNDVLDYSKMEAHKMDFLAAPFDLIECLDECMSWIRKETFIEGITVAYILSEGTPRLVIGDMTRIQQALNNLLAIICQNVADGEVVLHVSTVSSDYTPEDGLEARPLWGPLELEAQNLVNTEKSQFSQSSQQHSPSSSEPSSTPKSVPRSSRGSDSFASRSRLRQQMVSQMEITKKTTFLFQLDLKGIDSLCRDWMLENHNDDTMGLRWMIAKYLIQRMEGSMWMIKCAEENTLKFEFILSLDISASTQGQSSGKKSLDQYQHMKGSIHDRVPVLFRDPQNLAKWSRYITIFTVSNDNTAFHKSVAFHCQTMGASCSCVPVQSMKALKHMAQQLQQGKTDELCIVPTNFACVLLDQEKYLPSTKEKIEEMLKPLKNNNAVLALDYCMEAAQSSDPMNESLDSTLLMKPLQYSSILKWLWNALNLLVDHTNINPDSPPVVSQVVSQFVTPIIVADKETPGSQALKYWLPKLGFSGIKEIQANPIDQSEMNSSDTKYELVFMCLPSYDPFPRVVVNTCLLRERSKGLIAIVSSEITQKLSDDFKAFGVSACFFEMFSADKLARVLWRCGIIVMMKNRTISGLQFV